MEKRSCLACGAFIALSAAFSFSASADVWFNGGDFSKWPSPEEVTGGAWAKGSDESSTAIASISSYSDGAVTVEAFEAAAPLQFGATQPKDMSLDAVDFVSVVSFTAYEVLPAVPADAKAAITVMLENSELHFYGLAKDPLASPAANMWVKLSGKTPPGEDDDVTVKLSVKSFGGIAKVVYSVKLAGDPGFTVLSRAGSDPAVTDFESAVSDYALGNVGYSGFGKVKSLVASAVAQENDVDVGTGGLELHISAAELRKLGVEASWSAADITSFLNHDDVNGFSKWQNYVMQLNASDELATVVPQDENANSITLEPASELIARSGTGVALEYGLEKKSGSTFAPVADSTGGTIALDGADDPSGVYRLTVRFTDAGNNAEERAIPTEVGLMKIVNNSKTAILPVPWKELSADGDVKVENFVKTANLAEGTKLHVFNGEVYDSWTLGADHKWSTEKTYKVGADGVVTASAASAPADTGVARGKGVWLERTDANKSGPVFLYGLNPDSTSATELVSGANLLAVPSLGEFDPNGFLNASADDYILVPATGKRYVRKDTAWARIDTTVDEGGVKHNVLVTENIALPARDGFWYYANGEGAKPSVAW